MSDKISESLISAILEDSVDELKKINLRWAMGGGHNQ